LPISFIIGRPYIVGPCTPWAAVDRVAGFISSSSRTQLAAELLSRARAPTGFLSVPHPSFGWLVVSYPHRLSYFIILACLKLAGSTTKTCPIEDEQDQHSTSRVSFIVRAPAKLEPIVLLT